MKRYCLLAILLVIPLSMQGLPVGNPADASLLTRGVIWNNDCCCVPVSVRLGFYGDYVFQRHLETKTPPVKKIKETRISTNAGLITVNVMDRFDVFSTLGASRIVIASPHSAFGEPSNFANDIVTFEEKTHFSWSVGGRATLLNYKCWFLGIEGQYFSTTPKLNFVRDEGNPPIYFKNHHYRYHEYQVGWGISYKMCVCDWMVVPYIAGKWSHVFLRNKLENFLSGFVPTISPNFRNARSFGFCVGVTLTEGKCWSINGEGRFVDETAFALNSQIRF